MIFHAAPFVMRRVLVGIDLVKIDDDGGSGGPGFDVVTIDYF